MARKGKPKQKYFSVDARAVLTLGRESIKDHVTAVLELVKNSYDADATRVEIDIQSGGGNETRPLIRIADDGCGMSEGELEDNWLRIGYSEKKVKTSTRRKRRATGEKGIGRLSADRLGQLLEIRSKRSKKAAAGLFVDWQRFEQSGTDLQQVPIDVLEDPAPKLPRKAAEGTGTELQIYELRQGWTSKNLQALHNELALFVPPRTAMPDFRITLNTGDPNVDGLVKSSFNAHAEIEVDLVMDDESAISYRVHDRNKAGKQRKGKKQTIDWAQLTQRTGKQAGSAPEEPECGPTRVRLFFYPRKAEVLRGTELRLKDLRDFLDQHAGVRIYRDNIRVRPYGSTNIDESDWLTLGARKVADPAGPGRKSYRISPNQLVGAVFVGRDTNPELADSSSREGLVHNRAFEDLQRLVLGAIILLEQEYHDHFTKKNSDDDEPARSPRSVAVTLKEAARTVRSLKSAAEAGNESALDKGIQALPDVIAQLEASFSSMEEIASQAMVLRGLATVGIAGAVFGHETQTSLAQVIGSTRTAARLLDRDEPRVEAALREVNKAVNHADRVAAWGTFALARVKRDKRRRRKVEIRKLALDILRTLKPALEASAIDVRQRLSSIEGRTFAIDVEAVLINLLTNAYSACQQKSRNRTVRIGVKAKSRDGQRGVEIQVADSGPGVAKQQREKIWEPLFTTKVGKGASRTGTGLGLSIVESIVEEHGGVREVGRDPELKGALFTVWLPLG